MESLVETRRFDYESPEYGNLLGAPTSIEVRVMEKDGGFALSYRFGGEPKFRPWPGTRGKRAMCTREQLWGAVEKRLARRELVVV